MAGVLFEDIFDVKDIDPEGKKFDRGEGNLNVYDNLTYGMCSPQSVDFTAKANRLRWI